MLATELHLHFHPSSQDLANPAAYADNIHRIAAELFVRMQGVPQPVAPIAAAARPGPSSYPELPASLPAEFRAVAEENLRLLQSGEIRDQGWGRVKSLRAAIAKLPPETRAVVLRAIENGGHIRREEVYEVINRAPDKKLKGFTRPVNRLMTELQDRGDIPGAAEPLLHPIYKQSATYQQAQGFKVPVQVVQLFQQQATAN